MSDIGEFIWAGLAGGGISALLLAVAAALGKSQLAHWLNKDIEEIKSRHQSDLADKRAQYERELENYRASLIGAAEATKASQEVRKTVALLVAQKEFEAINALHMATTGLVTLAYAVWRSVEDDFPNQQLPELTQRIEDLGSTMHQAVFFLNTPTQKSTLQAYNSMLFDIRRECLDLDRVTGGDVGKEMDLRVVTVDNGLDDLMRDVLSRMKAMDA